MTDNEIETETEEYEVIIVDPGTEIDTGRHEDGDGLVVKEPTALWASKKIHLGAKHVRIIENGKVDDQPYFLHQPVKRQ